MKECNRLKLDLWKYRTLNQTQATTFVQNKMNAIRHSKNSPLWPPIDLTQLDQQSFIINCDDQDQLLDQERYQLCTDAKPFNASSGIRLDSFRISLSLSKRQLTVYGNEGQRILLQNPVDKAFLSLRFDQEKVKESRGFFQMHERYKTRYHYIQELCTWYYGTDLLTSDLYTRFKNRLDAEYDVSVTSTTAKIPYLTLQGKFLSHTSHRGSPLESHTHQCIAQWTMIFFVDAENSLQIVSICHDILIDDEHMKQITKSKHHQVNDISHLQARLCLRFAQDPLCSYYGLGTQYTWVDLRGKVVPILTQEPGIGRGIQPLSFIVEKGFRAGGSDVQSNAPAPYVLTSSGLCLYLRNYEYSIFDFSYDEQIRIELWSDTCHMTLIDAATPLQHIQTYTQYAGRMRPLPRWVQHGAIIGMQGGSIAVRDAWDQLKKAHVPIAAFWLQDWVGRRKTLVGEQLWWNWEVDRERYPDWPELLADLKEAGIRVLGYINPFLVDATQRAKRAEGATVDRDLYAEALEQELVICKSDKPYRILNTSFSALLLDLSKSETCTWIKDVIKTQMIQQGLSGWMADFGEALPFDAQLSESQASLFHNQYPEVWSRLNQEAIAELGLEDEVFFFTRSGFTRTPHYSNLAWLGDQLTSWHHEDGISSAVVGLLSSGMSGVSLNHSDIGGYTTTNPPWLKPLLPGIGYRRDQELMLRWIEINAFTAVFRTHEGNQPKRNHQINSDSLTLTHFSFFAKIYQALGFYRQELMQEAQKYGYPLVRHLWLHNPSDSSARHIDDQWLLGPDLLIAPILHQGKQQRTLYLPSGQWLHVWSHEIIDTEAMKTESKDKEDYYDGQWIEMAAPVAYPLVFIKLESTYTHRLREAFTQIHRPTSLEQVSVSSRK